MCGQVEALSAQLQAVTADRESLRLMLDRVGRQLDVERMQRFESSQVPVSSASLSSVKKRVLVEKEGSKSFAAGRGGGWSSGVPPETTSVQQSLQIQNQQARNHRAGRVGRTQKTALCAMLSRHTYATVHPSTAAHQRSPLPLDETVPPLSENKRFATCLSWIREVHRGYSLCYANTFRHV